MVTTDFLFVAMMMFMIRLSIFSLDYLFVFLVRLLVKIAMRFLRTESGYMTTGHWG
jgi:hypothetical protein